VFDIVKKNNIGQSAAKVLKKEQGSTTIMYAQVSGSGE
jgi:hypothetical protein